jgi:hypothetical protein
VHWCDWESKEIVMLRGALIAAVGCRVLGKSLVSVAAAAMLATALVPQTAATAEATKKAKPSAKTGPRAAPATSMKLRQPVARCDCTNCSAPHCGKTKEGGLKDLQAEDKLGNY